MVGRPCRREDEGLPTPRESRGPCAAGSPRSPLRPRHRRARGPRRSAVRPLSPREPRPLSPRPARAPRPHPPASHLPAPPWRTASGSSGSVRRRPALAVATQPRLPHANIQLSHWPTLAGAGLRRAGLRRAGPRLRRSPGKTLPTPGFSSRPAWEQPQLHSAFLRSCHAFVPLQQPLPPTTTTLFSCLEYLCTSGAPHLQSIQGCLFAVPRNGVALVAI